MLQNTTIYAQNVTEHNFYAQNVRFRKSVKKSLLWGHVDSLSEKVGYPLYFFSFLFFCSSFHFILFCKHIFLKWYFQNVFDFYSSANRKQIYDTNFSWN
jgi:hypothetical protein